MRIISGRRYRLTEVKQKGAVTEAYQFDANDSRIGFSSLLRGINNQSGSYAQGDQLVQSGNAAYQYDGNKRDGCPESSNRKF